MDAHSALDSRSYTTSDSTEHDLTALRATLSTGQEALDQRELGLAARQERIGGMDERVREVQRLLGIMRRLLGIVRRLWGNIRKR